MVHVDDALGRMEVKHETDATGPTQHNHRAEGCWGTRHEGAGARIATYKSEIRFCPITFIVCITVFVASITIVAACGRTPGDARMIDDMSQHNLILTLLGLISFISRSAVSRLRAASHKDSDWWWWWRPLLWRPAFSLFTFVSLGQYIEHLAKGSTSSLMKEGIVKGNRVEE
ncbi:hypothetical protein PTSG_00105 [Salpingoeca rosetta]|uniref:Uncharacterized protein n=1 Tax=Salpingoeca rosetta (strain ATCC 50818 / BSB-021) TaxID=946362 RepID=F2TVJ3_SALR5|nr:uncharacterized protein PTSG_00105 [Salpingoeca rosetta]EGD72089.1 hypothetical protein PTSG_00105 [Salpingoeca rosetta]|eukprot:XP_004998661.1 hypothetical protein PTSG_00105 [Salpingoeca rosetta]